MLRRTASSRLDSSGLIIASLASPFLNSSGRISSAQPKFRTRLACLSTLPPEPPSPHGTVASHRLYILLNSPSPPAAFPSRFSTPLQRALQLQVTRWGGIVNFAWTGSPDESDESTSLTAFSSLGGRIHLPNVSLANVEDVAETLKQHATAPPTTHTDSSDGQIHLYVCTHGARDCRCGDLGGKLFQALREEVDRLVLADPSGPAKSVVLGEVGHVGGHQFAANLLVFPHGEWLGMLTPHHVPLVLNAILSSEQRPCTSFDPPLCHDHWRGRMGLAKDEQLSLHSSHS
ncbi:Sucrase/ferredoxin-like-domain-containing protein [Mycena vulgaris]|nr:Sucrase/ferredoxin-like-domain-containing protein [Mycena vulgaris]